LVGATTPAEVRKALTASRKAAADHDRHAAERQRAAAALEEATRAAAAADRAAVEAGTDLGEDLVRTAEEADRIATRTAAAAADLARERAAELPQVIAAAAPEWLPVLLDEARATDAERRSPGFLVSPAYIAALDLAWERYWTVRAIGESRAPVHAHERRDRALALLGQVDATLDEYLPEVERWDAHLAAQAAEAERRAAWEAKVAAQNEREREIRRAQDAERRAPAPGQEV
jgi:hypothetical protein